MYLFLIRHGTTVHNLEKRHQHQESLLANEGITLIHEVAKNLTKLNLEIIYTSHFIRARQTAEILNKTLNLPLITNEKLREVKRPTAIEGRLHTNEEVVAIKKQIRENYHQENWHHSDEENYFELKKRALSFLQEIEEQKYERILVVTHGIVIKMLAALVIFDPELDSKTFQSFYDNTTVSNGGITTLRYKEGKWKLKNLNSTNDLNS